jgi:K+-transporting ATPase A subunit
VDASRHLLVVAQLAAAELVAMNPAVAELVASLVYPVAHPELSAVLVALVVALAHLPLALAVGPLVELVVVAKVESVEQAQVALLVQHS